MSSTWPDDARQRIHEEAEYLRSKLKGGRIYGCDVDPTNPDHVLVAAYYMKQAEDWDRMLPATKKLDGRDLSNLTGIDFA